MGFLNKSTLIILDGITRIFSKKPFAKNRLPIKFPTKQPIVNIPYPFCRKHLLIFIYKIQQLKKVFPEGKTFGPKTNISQHFSR